MQNVMSLVEEMCAVIVIRSGPCLGKKVHVRSGRGALSPAWEFRGMMDEQVLHDEQDGERREGCSGQREQCGQSRDNKVLCLKTMC